MPRQPRLDISDLVHHVIVRGINRDKIFRDDDDRRNFLQRFHTLLAETDTACYAWALIPNHFHLLVRPSRTPLASFMRRLLTGYAVTHNKRHGRCGHLFQNRYKSIVCEEDVYLFELIRYIHLNPLRAHLVSDMESLDQYPWCGHAEVLGKRPGCGLDVDGVLHFFGQKTVAARQAYHQFVTDGVDMGKRSELTGGGLRRSQTRSPTPDKISDFDDRILGSGEFVSQLRDRGLLIDPRPPAINLRALQETLESYYNIGENGLLQRGRMNSSSAARNVFCFYAVRLLLYSGVQVSQHLKIGPPSVSRAIRKGEKAITADYVLADCLQQLLKH